MPRAARSAGLVVLALHLAQVVANIIWHDFNDTTGLVFVGSAGTTDCRFDKSKAYGDVQYAADLFNENANTEISETTDEVSQSSVTTNVDTFNVQIATQQAGFLHINNTKSAPKICSGRVRLTPSGPSKAGAMWYRSEVSVSGGFMTTFTFQITDHSKECSVHKDQYFSQFSYRTCSVHGGDGFAFVIHNSPSASANGTIYKTVGQNGGQMGFGGIPNSLAVAFDTWQNPGEDRLGVDHISIQTLGMNPNDALEKGLLGVPRATTLADGNVHMAQIIYFPQLMPKYLDKLSASAALLPYLLDNGEQKRVGTLVVFMDDGIDTDIPLLAMPINLSLVVRMPSDVAFVGFTASTGRFYEKHDILQWQWCEQNCTTPTGFDLHTVSKISNVGYQSFRPGSGYGGSADAVDFPTKNENPQTDPWAQPMQHFANARTRDLFSSAELQVPPATLY